MPSQATDEVVRLLRLIESDGPFNPDVNETGERSVIWRMTRVPTSDWIDE